jgi:hypothetical protein
VASGTDAQPGAGILLRQNKPWKSLRDDEALPMVALAVMAASEGKIGETLL